MDDLISRQAAIDFVDAGHLCNPNEPRWSDNDVVNFLESRPPAQQWIPCSERLPKLDNSYPNSKEYLTQWDDGRIDITRYSNVNIFWQNEITEPYWKGEQCSKVIAWMSLPDPYKGEES